MVNVKENFNLLKNVPNILNLSKSEIQDYSIQNGPRKMFVILELNKSKINHFSKDKVFGIISNLEKRKDISIVNIPNYNLHTSYNEPTKQIILNLSPFNVDDIYANEPDHKNLYTQLVYGLVFSDLVTGKVKIKDNYFVPISNFLFSIIFNLFGKNYGLLGSYSEKISDLNFLVNCYVLSSFFNISGKKSYIMSSTVTSFDYRSIEKELNNYDFSNIENFIKALSKFEVMPGLDKYAFVNKIFKTTGLSFLPGLEDLSRFIGIMTCISMKGSSIVPTFLSKYNEDSFLRIIEISRVIFK